MDRDEVLRIARLARLELDAAEAERLAADLARILEHIAVLKEVGSGEEEPPAPFETDVHREDRIGGYLEREDALANAPETDGVFFLVPRLLDRET